jgi:hypothetical protein
VTKTVSPPAANRMYSLSLFLSSLMPTDLMATKVATGGYFVNDAREHRFEPRWLYALLAALNWGSFHRRQRSPLVLCRLSKA